MNQILIGIDHDTMRVYQAEAEKRGYPSGQALISALLADWPAVLAPVAPTILDKAYQSMREAVGKLEVEPQPEPRERTLEDQVASLGNVLGAALARIAILESAQSPKGAVTEAQDTPFGGTY